MKYINFAFAVVCVLVALISAGIHVYYIESGYSMGGPEVTALRLKLGSIWFLFGVCGFCLVVVWAEGELYHQWDRVSWVVGNLFVLGFIYILMQEEQIGWFIALGINKAIHNLGG